MERAVPATMALAASMSLALRSGILISAILVSCSWVSWPTLSRWGTPEPLLMPSSFLMSWAAGGVLQMKVKERSS